MQGMQLSSSASGFLFVPGDYEADPDPLELGVGGSGQPFVVVVEPTTANQSRKGALDPELWAPPRPALVGGLLISSTVRRSEALQELVELEVVTPAAALPSGKLGNPSSHMRTAADHRQPHTRTLTPRSRPGS